MLVKENVLKINLNQKNTIRHFIQTDIITFKPFSILKMGGNFLGPVVDWGRRKLCD